MAVAGMSFQRAGRVRCEMNGGQAEPLAQMTFRCFSYKLALMLDVRRMRVLREVAIQGSFSAAAEALSFTQSAVSQQIAALERETGTILVQRSARGVRLTEAGEALVRHADAVLGRLAEAEAELEAIAGLRGGRLRMAAFESAGATLMPLAIAEFRAGTPRSSCR